MWGEQLPHVLHTEAVYREELVYFIVLSRLLFPCLCECVVCFNTCICFSLLGVREAYVRSVITPGPTVLHNK